MKLIFVHGEIIAEEFLPVKDIGVKSRTTKRVTIDILGWQKKQVCMHFFKNVNVGAKIMTDSWRDYLDLCLQGYQHYNVYHRLHFVGLNDVSIHTQNIERLCKTYKPKYVNTNDNGINSVRYARGFDFGRNMSLRSASPKFEIFFSK